MGGRGKGVFSDFRMARVCWLDDRGIGKHVILTQRQYQFRMNALAGKLPGVRKGLW